MEVGKRLEEAGPSSAGTVDEQRREKPREEASGKHSEASDVGEEDVDDKDGFTPGPLLSLKEQIEKDKDDESLRRWKEKLLGCLESDLSVDRTQGMLGTFAPQREPYVETLEEETTPSGVLARGIYSAKLKFEDDDKRCYMELQYSFEIKKSS